ncbi:MAG: hypothetical protein K2V38_21070, partial [Gemmataceae bacterium]|nr:hypothetical protein [Gemmataceae bacterium]
RELELYSRLDLIGPEPLLRGDTRLFDIRDRKTGKSVVRAQTATHCSGAPLVEVPPDGFYCRKVDLNRLAGDALAPGEYEVEWRSGAWRSKPVPFTVIARDEGRKPEPPPARPMLRFFHLTEDMSDEERVEKAADRNGPHRLNWDATELKLFEADDMAAALAVGQTGVYVPDLYQIPARDKLIAVEAVFKPHRDGDRIAVTVRAVPPHQKIEFDEPLQLFLQLETPMRADDGVEARKRLAKDVALKAITLTTTPLTIEARLPEGWREQVGVSGPAKLSVLVVSKELRIPEAGAQKVNDLKKRQEQGDADPPCWSGVLRTASTPVHLPLTHEVPRR